MKEYEVSLRVQFDNAMCVATEQPPRPTGSKNSDCQDVKQVSKTVFCWNEAPINP